MSDDYLKNQRNKSLSDDSKISEAELHATNDGIREAWLEMQDVKRRIFKAKQEAIAKVDADFADDLKAAEDTYALQLTLTR